MKLRVTLMFLITASAILLSACRTAPVHDVIGAPVVVTDESYDLRAVRDAIIDAGVSLGWQMEPTAPGEILGTLNIRTHMAQVKIPYDMHFYSIIYVSSSNLNYTGTEIHSNYNGWIQNLDNAIRSRLLVL